MEEPGAMKRVLAGRDKNQPEWMRTSAKSRYSSDRRILRGMVTLPVFGRASPDLSGETVWKGHRNAIGGESVL
jgi:hypothetical protein